MLWAANHDHFLQFVWWMWNNMSNIDSENIPSIHRSMYSKIQLQVQIKPSKMNSTSSISLRFKGKQKLEYERQKLAKLERLRWQVSEFTEASIFFSYKPKPDIPCSDSSQLDSTIKAISAQIFSNAEQQKPSMSLLLYKQKAFPSRFLILVVSFCIDLFFYVFLYSVLLSSKFSGGRWMYPC